MAKEKRASGKTRSQIAALPIRRSPSGKPQVLLITSRSTRRWIVPKGWPMKGKKGHEAAAREAREEAGIVGKVRKKPAGCYNYWKRMDDHFVLCKVTVYLLHARSRLNDWAERNQRLSHWFTLKDAADIVDDPGLKATIRALKVD
jgi:8-oxo-dGTP pyrophosphatase MutT (NUDIX family)